MSFNAAFEANKFSFSQRQGVSTLIPKEDRSLLELSNWRPITLLIVHFKAAPNVLAKRIESSLSNLVHSDHNGFIKGR